MCIREFRKLQLMSRNYFFGIKTLNFVDVSLHILHSPTHSPLSMFLKLRGERLRVLFQAM